MLRYIAQYLLFCSYKEFAGIAALVERIFCWDFLQGNMEGPTVPRVGTKGEIQSFEGRCRGKDPQFQGSCRRRKQQFQGYRFRVRDPQFRVEADEGTHSSKDRCIGSDPQFQG